MLSKSEEKLLHALKSRAGREKHAAFVAEGVRVVEELVAAGIDLKFAAVSPTLEDNARGRALRAGLTRAPVHELSDAQLRALSETDAPQGVIVVAATPQYELPAMRVPAQSLVLVLDAIQDPGNLGTLIRSADAFFASCVLALPGTVDYWNPKVVRSAAGTSFHLPLINATDEAAWSWLEQNEFEVCGADMDGVDVSEAKPGARVALVVGNEGAGLRAETAQHINRTIGIPMPGRAESLNVAVAAGILLYELSKRGR